MRQVPLESNSAREPKVGAGVVGRSVGGLRLFASCASFVLLCLVLARSHAESFSEVEVRAVYLFNFAVFVDWPPTAFESSTSPIRYCVVGSQALRASLEEVLADEHVGGRALRLISANEPLDWRRCHLLYIGHGAKTRARQILKAVRGTAVLTIGASEAFVREGGMIGLVRRGQRLRTIIDRDAAERVGIRISSKLLRLSTLVSGTREGVSP
ncbi:hypothetical protein ThidrDRAFT_0653 [Thiorhodococcus drewsii AZ1]|uniref:Transmembrane protein n=1 Tax=Thiorhodococcus drewsii AZ1 TaxID=765913 RepID=G2DX92_9GAMM|nr:YfiR family protein [Thiorhodococcus drewsii]EGV33446.1 hypothetical protein ThidrDRAFT_0653 [Thiorhodococcus drewsii AZ1]